ncbi:hypothetical protein [Tessaracoccus coleopterorum]|uniref:hypothetical protein n=1 Tax=Tessaracoccus coleopterorum TaxID=2714950 RepID=UPI001E50CF72|nr:hypothetical protein [Tessaracoccus coleopterorum]
MLMRPVMLIAMILGSMSGLFVATITGAGLVGPPSPGSIIAYFAVTPPTGYIPMILTVLTATVVSFAIASALLRFGKGADDSAELAAATTAAPSPTARVPPLSPAARSARSSSPAMRAWAPP